MFQHSSIVAFIVHMHAHEWLREADRRRLVESALQLHPFSQGPHEARSELQQISAEVSVCVVRSSQAAPLERWDETVGDLDDVLTDQACHPWTGDKKPIPPTSSMTSPMRAATWSGVPTSSIDRSTRSDASNCAPSPGFSVLV
jgi:hypothetical protein